MEGGPARWRKVSDAVAGFLRADGKLAPIYAHEHEAPGGGSGRRLHCRLTSFSRSLQTILHINIDGTIFCGPGMRNGNKPKVQMSRVFTSLPEKDTRLIVFDLEAQDARQSYAATWDSKSDPLSLK